MGYNYQFVSKKHVYNQYIKTKIKLYNDKIDKSFHGNVTAKEDVC